MPCPHASVGNPNTWFASRRLTSLPQRRPSRAIRRDGLCPKRAVSYNRRPRPSLDTTDNPKGPRGTIPVHIHS
mgnify:CR=1 FL=1